MLSVAALTWPFCSQRTDMPPRKETHRRASDTEEMLNQVLAGSGATAKDPQVEAEMKTTGLGRMVDMKIPLVWIIGLLGSFAGFQVILWFSVQSLTQSMLKVDAKLEAGNAQTVQTLIETNRLKDRLDRMVEDIRNLQQQVTRQQYEKATR